MSRLSVAVANAPWRRVAYGAGVILGCGALWRLPKYLKIGSFPSERVREALVSHPPNWTPEHWQAASGEVTRRDLYGTLTALERILREPQVGHPIKSIGANFILSQEALEDAVILLSNAVVKEQVISDPIRFSRVQQLGAVLADKLGNSREELALYKHRAFSEAVFRCRPRYFLARKRLRGEGPWQPACPDVAATSGLSKQNS
eukprot:TRINITY_DN15172_c0_g1_i1.p1 TRINITY_DN15172_c0_g1~~TRINITY_DN15172_c0_g1_i1.p1  ORF type:complete len:203 (+),score=20.50 TRINITY_DN15172_c0_g1_i1:56-664(+)